VERADWRGRVTSCCQCEEESPCFLIPEKLGLHGEPNSTSGGGALRDGIREIARDGANMPRPQDEVHTHPIWRVGCGDVGENMTLQQILPNSKKEDSC
jgi:hypothetical protein